MAVASMRGLSVFISDIRNCQNKEAERARVDKELANIRTHFKSERALSAYEKKKYVWKLLYIYMLGYEVEFGLVEATSLISATKYAEKQVGYMVTASLLNENHDFLRLVINTVRNDIVGRNDTNQCLALTMVGNVGGKEFAESLAPDVEKLLMSTSLRPLVRKKAALCLLRLYRKSPELVNHESWAEKMAVLLGERDLGVLLCVTTFFITLLAANPEAYVPCQPRLLRILERLVRVADISQDYTYYAIPSPWLQVKVMRALQYFPQIEDPGMHKALRDILVQILQKTETVKNVNKNNALHGILFEAMALAMHIEADEEVLGQCVTLLGKFIGMREPNIRYLGLENMGRMLQMSDVQGAIRMYQAQIVASLKDPDISIRRRALDLLYGMCDEQNGKEIVEELLQYLTHAEFAIREELTLKTAVLAEKFAPNLSWYVDVVLDLTEKAGDFVSDDIWFRVVHIVTNNEELQPYAAGKVLQQIRKPGTHETMVKMGGYILGEFGHLLASAPPPNTATSGEVFSALHEKFATASVPTKALLLSAYIKVLMRAPPSDTSLSAKALAVFTKYGSYVDAEVQQRAVEYAVLASKGHSLADIMAEMPKFPERESALVKKAEDKEGDAAEVSAVKLKQQQSQSQALVPVTAASSRPVFAPGATKAAEHPGPEAAAASAASPDASPAEDPAAQAGSAPLGPSLSDTASSAPTQEARVGGAGTATPPPAASPPSAKQVGDLLGELLLLEAPPPAPALAATSGPQGAPQPAGAAGPSALDTNPLAIALLDGAAAAPGTPAAPAVQPLGSVADWLRALLVKDSGVLYEDPHIQIGVKAEWSGPHGRLVLFLGNKDTAPLTAVQASVGPTAGLRIMLASSPPVLPPRAQIQVPVEAAAVLAPREVPVLNFSYTTASSVTVPLRLHLPVLISKFMQPASLAAPDFFARWKALAGPPLKLQEVLRGVKPLPLAQLSQFLNSLKVSVVPNLDPNPNNLVACCTLFTETTPPVLLMARIETDPADRTQMRLTVASQEPSATLSLKEFIKEQVSEAGPAWLMQPMQQPSVGPGGAAGAMLQLPAPPTGMPTPSVPGYAPAAPSTASPSPGVQPGAGFPLGFPQGQPLPGGYHTAAAPVMGPGYPQGMLQQHHQPLMHPSVAVRAVGQHYAMSPGVPQYPGSPTVQPMVGPYAGSPPLHPLPAAAAVPGLGNSGLGAYGGSPSAPGTAPHGLL